MKAPSRVPSQPCNRWPQKRIREHGKKIMNLVFLEPDPKELLRTFLRLLPLSVIMSYNPLFLPRPQGLKLLALSHELFHPLKLLGFYHPSCRLLAVPFGTTVRPFLWWCISRSLQRYRQQNTDRTTNTRKLQRIEKFYKTFMVLLPTAILSIRSPVVPSLFPHGSVRTDTYADIQCVTRGLWTQDLHDFNHFFILHGCSSSQGQT